MKAANGPEFLPPPRSGNLHLPLNGLVSAAIRKLSAGCWLTGWVVLVGCGSLSEVSELCPNGEASVCAGEGHTDRRSSLEVSLGAGFTSGIEQNAKGQDEDDTLLENGTHEETAPEAGESVEDNGQAHAENGGDATQPLLPCERRGVFSVAHPGRVNGVVQVAFSRPENLRSDWQNLIFLVDNMPVPFIVASDDGVSVQLFVYLNALAAEETPWHANSCRSEPNHGPTPRDVWQYQLAPVSPNADTSTAPETTGFELECTTQDNVAAAWGCGLLMYRDEAETNAWAIALRSRSGCSDYSIPGNYGHIERSLSVPSGTYRIQGVMGAKAERYEDCESALAAQATLSVGETSDMNAFGAASASEIRFSGSHLCNVQTQDEVLVDIEVPLSPTSRIRLAVDTGDCEDATVNLSDLRVYRLPDIEVESAEVGAHLAD